MGKGMIMFVKDTESSEGDGDDVFWFHSVFYRSFNTSSDLGLLIQDHQLVSRYDYLETM
jgi:hypothetical protein